MIFSFSRLPTQQIFCLRKKRCCPANFCSSIDIIKIEISTFFFRFTDRPQKNSLEEIREAKNQLCLALRLLALSDRWRDKLVLRSLLYYIWALRLAEIMVKRQGVHVLVVLDNSTFLAKQGFELMS